MYPQDELSRIKMRNRRFQSSLGGGPDQPPVDPAMAMMGAGGAGGYPAVPTHPMMISPQAYYGERGGEVRNPLRPFIS